MASWQQKSPQANKNKPKKTKETKKPNWRHSSNYAQNMDPCLQVDTLLGTFGIYCRQSVVLGLRWVCVGSVFTWQPSALSAAAPQKLSPHRARDFLRTDSLMGSTLNSGSHTSFLSWSKTHITKRTNHSSRRCDCQRYLCAFPNKDPNWDPLCDMYVVERVKCVLVCDRCHTLLFQVEYCSILYSDPLQWQTNCVLCWKFWGDLVAGRGIIKERTQKLAAVTTFEPVLILD